MTNRLLAAALAVPVLCACAHAQEATRIVPESWQGAYDTFHYAPAVKAGDTLYLSGVVAALQGDETENNPEDVAAAFERAFVALDEILTASGASWTDVVEVTTFHTELIPQIPAFTAVKDKWMPEPYPAWTAIDVDRLYLERGLVEIKIIAYVPD